MMCVDRYTMNGKLTYVILCSQLKSQQSSLVIGPEGDHHAYITHKLQRKCDAIRDDEGRK